MLLKKDIISYSNHRLYDQDEMAMIERTSAVDQPAFVYKVKNVTCVDIMADENMLEEAPENVENGGSEEPESSDEDISEDDIDSLNMQLDELNSALDILEQKNDDIQAQLVMLLESNRETRQQFQENIAKLQNQQQH